MTNKPMLSVELRNTLADFIEYSVPGPRSDDEMWYADKQALRALLDNPEKDYVLINGMYFSHAEILEWREKACADMEKAAQHQGEPVYMVRSQGSDCWEEMSGESLEMCQAQPAEYEVRKLYAEQRAPVAHESECTSCYGSGEYTDAIGDWRGYCTCPSGVEAEGLKGLKP